VLAPYPSELMEAHEVSSLVNKSEYDRADCLKRVVERQFRLV
jgi:putative SOS response-associated peptidase YedK